MNTTKNARGALSARELRNKRVQKIVFKIAVFTLVPLLIILSIFFLLMITKPQTVQPPSSPLDGIGVVTAHNGETIGISDGSYAFEVNGPDGILKREAADKLRNHDSNGAIALWNQAIELNSTDAETRIYLENQHVISSQRPYITIVIGTILTGPNVGVGGSNLQGAFVAQEEFNRDFELPHGWQVRLLIANSGSHKEDAAIVAKQIIKLSQTDKTVVGIMGWPFSDQTLDALNILGSTHLSMISAAGGDSLTNKAPHFFRISTPASLQANVAARYAEQTWQAKNAVIFTDPQDSYSQNLAHDFSEQFKQNNQTVTTVTYTEGQGNTVVTALNNLLSSSLTPPDLIYFAGYASDASSLLATLPSTMANIPVMGPDSLYELGGYQDTAYPAISHLRLTSFAYPDEWDVLGFLTQKPKFFADYTSIFDHQNQHPNEYGFSRADGDVMLAYDGLITLLQASHNVLNTKTTITPSDLQTALTQITGNQAIQGISGQISFGRDGNATNKEILVLCLSTDKKFHMAEAQGQFLLSGPIHDQTGLTADCN